MKRDNKAFWQMTAGIYSVFTNKSVDMYDKVSEHISKYLTEDMHVLELACGTGQITFRLADKCQVWEATDFSEKMIEKAKQKDAPFSLNFTVQDATDLSFYGDNCFDAVVISNALHIMPEPEKALKEIKRVLKPNGYLFAPTFIKDESLSFRLYIKIMSIFGFKVYHLWNKKELIRFVENHGFHVKNYANVVRKWKKCMSLVAISDEVH